MADVAAVAGMSTGSVYTYVDSKEALLHLVLTTSLAPRADGLPEPDAPPELPVSAPPLEATLADVRDFLDREGSAPVLRAALDAEEPDDVREELAAILQELYTIVSRLWPLLSVLEQCAPDIPAIQEFYFGGRGKQLSRLAHYVRIRSAAGRLHSFGDPELSAQLAVEAITWHAWHRLEGFDGARFSESGSRDAVIEFAVTALAGD
jgi:AcrR family transcriptional regulator